MALRLEGGADPPDGELVRRAAGGDSAAVARLYDRHAPVLYAVAFRVTRDATDAEEAVAEAFAQAWRSADRFDGARGSVPAWLATMARTRALDLVRARARRERAGERAAASGEAPAPSGDAPDPAMAVEADERRRQVAAALGGLSDVQRQAIELAFYGGLSHSEIAERLGEPLGTVKTRIRGGMQRLREVLRPYFLDRPS